MIIKTATVYTYQNLKSLFIKLSFKTFLKMSRDVDFLMSSGRPLQTCATSHLSWRCLFFSLFFFFFALIFSTTSHQSLLMCTGYNHLNWKLTIYLFVYQVCNILYFDPFLQKHSFFLKSQNKTNMNLTDSGILCISVCIISQYDTKSVSCNIHFVILCKVFGFVLMHPGCDPQNLKSLHK